MDFALKVCCTSDLQPKRSLGRNLVEAERNFSKHIQTVENICTTLPNVHRHRQRLVLIRERVSRMSRPVVHTTFGHFVRAGL